MTGTDTGHVRSVIFTADLPNLMRPNRTTRAKRVKAADRTLDMFEAFGETGRPLNLSELARAVDVPVSSCHSLVKTLTSRGYLVTAGAQRMYYPTRRLFDLARKILARDPVLAKARPALESLRDQSDETVIVGKRLDDYVIYLDVIETAQTIRYSAEASSLKPLHSSSMGKALLAALPDDELSELVGRLDLKQITRNTICSARKLLADVRTGRERGWQMTRGENVVDVMAIASSVRLGGEDYAVAVAGPLDRMEPAIPRHAKALRAAINAIAAERVNDFETPDSLI